MLDTTFALKAMPFCRVKSQASQTISLGTNGTPATGIGYGWDTDSLAGYILYFMSGASRGLMRVVSANNNNNGTGGTITYTGDALTVAAGDSFIILPSDTNFRLLGDIYNNASSNITINRTVGNCSSGIIETTFNGWLNPMWARKIYVSGCGGGAGGATGGGNGGGGGGSGKCAVKVEIGLPDGMAGAFYNLTIGAGGSVGLAGGTTSFGAAFSLPGGGAPSSNIGGASGGDGGAAGGDGEQSTGCEFGGKGASGMFGPAGAGGDYQAAGKAAGKYGAGGGGGGGGGSYSGAAGSVGFLEIETKI